MHEETERETVLYNKQFVNSKSNYFKMWAMAELTAQTHSHLWIGLRKKRERRMGRRG